MHNDNRLSSDYIDNYITEAGAFQPNNKKRFKIK